MILSIINDATTGETMKLKPLPKLILIVGIVALAGFGISTALKSQKSTTPDPTAVPAPAVTTVAPPAPNATPAPAPIVEASAPVAAPADTGGLKAAGANDAGLDAVLNAAKKK